MATKELVQSRRRSSNPDTYERSYVAWSIASEDAATSAALALAPATLSDLPVAEYSAAPYGDLEDAWQVDVVWRAPEASEEDGGAGDPPTGPDPGDPGQGPVAGYQFELGSATTNVKQSLGTTAYGSGTAAGDFNNGVLYDPKEDRFLGADVTIPTFGFAETHHHYSSVLTSAYIQTIYGLFGKYNSTTFRGFPAGEVLFAGAAGSRRSGDVWEVTYRFEATPNVTGLTIGQVAGIAKLGWQYLWARYGESTGEGPSFVAPPVEGVYVEDLYQPANFTGLLIG